jgi:hypothetical protein
MRRPIHKGTIPQSPEYYREISEQLSPEYLKSDGLLCPFCGSSYIVAGDIEFEVAEVWQDVRCNDCKKEWNEVYTLTRIEPLIRTI